MLISSCLSSLSLHVSCAYYYNRGECVCAVALLGPENNFVVAIHYLWFSHSFHPFSDNPSALGGVRDTAVTKILCYL